MGRDDHGQACLLRILLIKTPDHHPIISQADHLKGIPGFLPGVLLEGLIEQGMKVFKRNRISPGKWVSPGFVRGQNPGRSAGIKENEGSQDNGYKGEKALRTHFHAKLPYQKRNFQSHLGGPNFQLLGIVSCRRLPAANPFPEFQKQGFIRTPKFCLDKNSLKSILSHGPGGSARGFGDRSLQTKGTGRR